MNDMKIDKINKLFHCNYCSSVFKEPIVLPCGETVCRKDLAEFTSTSTHIECYFCQQQHMKPSTSHEYPVVKQLVTLIELGNHNINLGETFAFGRNLINESSLKITELNSINENKALFLNGFFERLINEVIMKRDQMKLEIDIHFNQILADLRQHKSDCEANLSKLETFDSFLKKELDSYKLKLANWHNALDTLIVNEKQRDRVVLETKLAKTKLDHKLNDLKCSVLLDKLYEIKSEPFEVTKYLSLEVQIYFFILKFLKFNG